MKKVTQSRRISLDEPVSEEREKFKDEMQSLLDELDEMYADNLRIGDLRKILDYSPSVNLREKAQIEEIIDILDSVGLDTSAAKALLQKAVPEQRKEDSESMHKREIARRNMTRKKKAIR